MLELRKAARSIRQKNTTVVLPVPAVLSLPGRGHWQDRMGGDGALLRPGAPGIGPGWQEAFERSEETKLALVTRLVATQSQA